jgi:hypothetical protein
MAYSDKVLDHYENPRNVGAFDKNADDVGTGMVGAPACGDVMKLQIKVNAVDQEHPDRRRTGAAAGEDPLLDPGRGCDQGRRRRL